MQEICSENHWKESVPAIIHLTTELLQAPISFQIITSIVCKINAANM
jgi:hypothetical protein